MARQVQVALHHQVAIGRGADDLQPGAQVESFRVGGIVQSSQLAVEQGAIGQRRLHEQFALLVLAIQVGLGDLLVRPAVARRQSGDRRVVVALHGTEGDGAGADLQRRTGVDGDIARRRPAQTRRVQVEGAAGDAVVLPGALPAAASVPWRRSIRAPAPRLSSPSPAFSSISARFGESMILP